MRHDCILGIIFSLATGCAAARPAHDAAPRGPSLLPAVEPLASARAPASSSPGRRECPAENPATRVIAQEVEGGAALVFTAPEDAADLRRRVVDLPLPTAVERAELSSDNIRNGIRLVFKTSKHGDVSQLRETLDRYAEQIAGRCGLTLAPPKEPRTAPVQKDPAKKPAPKLETTSKVVVPPHKTTGPAKPPAPPKPPVKPVAKPKPSESASAPRASTKPPSSMTNPPSRARPGLPRQRGPNPNRWRTRRFAPSSVAALLRPR